MFLLLMLWPVGSKTFRTESAAGSVGFGVGDGCCCCRVHAYFSFLCYHAQFGLCFCGMYSQRPFLGKPIFSSTDMISRLMNCFKVLLIDGLY